ncbi:MAG TPA: hypothetical protein VF545_05305 [Thermoleophilaceae bacterium]|jgi:hypothetical protein
MTARGFFAVLVVLACVAPASASAAFDSCVHDSTTRTVTATLNGSDEGRLYVAASGAIVSGAPPSGGAQCGAATTANTDRVEVRGKPTLAAETATIDNSGPGGAFRKAGGADEIVVDVDLGETPWTYEPGDVGAQTLKLVATPAADEIRSGQWSLYGQGAVNLDAQSDADVDAILTNVSVLDLDGGDGDDHVTGLGGTGTVEQYGGNLVLRGGAGNDRLVGNRRANVIYPGAGVDDVDGGSPGGKCTAGYCGAVDIVSYEDAPAPVTIGYPHTNGNDDGFGARDNYTDVEGIRGSGHDDTLTNTGVPGILLDGAGGDDEIRGGYQADTLLGGEGDDYLRSDPSASFSREEADFLYGGPGNDALDGGQDPDVLKGGAGNDVLNAGVELSANYEYSTSNSFDGGPGNDALNGGSGDDWYVFHPPVGGEVDTIRELPGGGRDTVEASWGEPAFGEPTTDHTFDLSSDTTALGTGGSRTFLVASPGQAVNLEDVTTGWGADQVTGNAAVNHLTTGLGADVVRARDDVRDTVNCGVDDPVHDPDTAIVDALDEVTGCETVDRSAPPAEPAQEPADPPSRPADPPAEPAGPRQPAPTQQAPAAKGSGSLSLRYGRSLFAARLPLACVSPLRGIPLRVTRSRTRSSSLTARLVRATFFVDGERIATDHRAPFATHLPTGISRGAHTVTIRLLLKPVRRTGGRTVVRRFTTRTLTGVVEICE